MHGDDDRQTSISFICADQDTGLTALKPTENPTKHYHLEWKTPDACPTEQTVSGCEVSAQNQSQSIKCDTTHPPLCTVSNGTLIAKCQSDTNSSLSSLVEQTLVQMQEDFGICGGVLDDKLYDLTALQNNYSNSNAIAKDFNGNRLLSSL